MSITTTTSSSSTIPASSGHSSSQHNNHHSDHRQEYLVQARAVKSDSKLLVTVQADDTIFVGTATSQTTTTTNTLEGNERNDVFVSGHDGHRACRLVCDKCLAASRSSSRFDNDAIVGRSPQRTARCCEFPLWSGQTVAGPVLL